MNQRQNEIYQQLLVEGPLRVRVLAQRFSVSMETIRHDLDQLEQAGLIIKQHGKASLNQQASQLPTSIKVNEHALAKQQMGRQAIELIADHATLYLDPSSTSLAITRYLYLRKGLTIVTNGLAVAQAVSQSSHQLLLLGGMVLKKSHAATGVFTDHMLDRLNLDIAFNGADGLMGGASTYSIDEMAIKQKVMTKAKKNILLCDQSKWDKQAHFVYATFDEFDIFLTNSITESQRQLLNKRLVVIEAEKKPLYRS